MVLAAASRRRPPRGRACLRRSENDANSTEGSGASARLSESGKASGYGHLDWRRALKEIEHPADYPTQAIEHYAGADPPWDAVNPSMASQACIIVAKVSRTSCTASGSASPRARSIATRSGPGSEPRGATPRRQSLARENR